MDSPWLSLDDALHRACEAMTVGDLVHAEAFSLFESMSAVECGNPKMDAAAVAARSSVEELLASGAAPVAELSAAQLIEVLDRLVVMEAGWLDGGALAQTIYTCLYMLRPDRLVDHAVLSAYCQALRASVQAVRSLVVLGGVAEEEDFAFHTAGLPLDDPPSTSAKARAQQATADPCIAALEAAIATCSGTAPQQGDGGVDDRSALQLGSEAQRAAIVLRLTYRRELHQGLCCINGKASRDTAAAVRHFAAAREHLLLIRPAASAAPSVAAAGAKAGPSAAPAAPAGDLAAATAAAEVAAPGRSEPQALGFDMEMNRHLLGPAPPRVVKLLSQGEACDFLCAVMQQLQMAVELSHCTSYDSLQAAVQRFARLAASALPRSVGHYLLTPKAWGSDHNGRAAKPLPPCVPGRDMLAAAIGLPATPTGAVDAASAQAGAANSKMDSDRPTEGDEGAAGGASTSSPAAGALPAPGPELELFLEQATIATSNWVQAMLMNRSRQRRRLRRGFEDWTNLYEHGVNADMSEGFSAFMAAAGWQWATHDENGLETQGLLAAWVERHTSSCIVQHLMMGFALDLYHPHEYAMIYWYCDYLLAIIQTCTHMLYERHPVNAALAREQQQQQEEAASPPKPAGPLPPRKVVKVKGGKAAAKAAAAAAAAAANNGAGSSASTPLPAAAAIVFPQTAEDMLAEVQSLHLSLDVDRQLCQAMLRMLVGLAKAGLLKTPYGPNGCDPPFNAEVQRYDQRFAVLHTLPRPGPLFYDEYLLSVEASTVDVTNLLGLSGEALLKARRALQLVVTHLPPAIRASPEASAEAIAAWRSLDRVALQNCVALNVLNTGLSSGAPLVVTFDFCHHPTYPVIVAKGRKQV